MAKKIIVQEKKSNYVYPYPSRFGSHSSMIDNDKTEELKKVFNSKVVCKDEWGEYITEHNRVDNGLADPNRFDGSRLRYEKTKAS